MLGGLVAALLVLLPAEAYLRHFPPPDLHEYLAEDSPLAGPYRPDATRGAAYRDFEAFRAGNRERWNSFEAETSDVRPIWAMFGNSFVQAPGMLADTARARVSDRRIFNLGRNEPLPARFAQVSLLLQRGWRPERIFFALMPVDVLQLGEQPLSTWCVSRNGAIAYRPRLPAGLAGGFPRYSRIGLAAWVRLGLHRGNPRFNKRKLYESIDPVLLGDLQTLFTSLGKEANGAGVPVTVLLIPSIHQVLRGDPYGFQDALTPMLERAGLDVFDPRDAFARAEDKRGLFLPDMHLGPAGNDLLLAELRRHLDRARPLARRPAGGPTQ